MQLTTKHYYDDETFEHVLSKFYIDGEQVDFESYQDFLGGLEEYNKDEEELADDNPYQYNVEDEVCECDTCKYKDKKKYESCNDDCKYMNCDECCNDDEEDICNECKCNYECADKLSDQEIEELKLIAHFTDEVLKREGCPDCTFDLLRELFSIGKEIGWNDCEEELVEGENEDGNNEVNNEVNNITCNLTVNNTNDDVNKVAEQIFNMINNATRWG